MSAIGYSTHALNRNGRCWRATHGQPLGVIGLAGGEEGLEGVVGGDDEAGGVDEELSGDVEEDQEEVKGTEAKDDVDLGHIGLLLKLLQLRVLGQLLVELRQVELGYRVRWSVTDPRASRQLSELIA